MTDEQTQRPPHDSGTDPQPQAQSMTAPKTPSVQERFEQLERTVHDLAQTLQHNHQLSDHIHQWMGWVKQFFPEPAPVPMDPPVDPGKPEPESISGGGA